MKFDEMEIKGIYNSEQVNVYHQFFNKLLPESKMYQRFGGFFSSKNFAHCARGLQDFIKNNRGKMELSIIPIFTEEEIAAIHEGILPEKIITQNWIGELTDIQEQFEKNHTKALAWMLARGDLEIKIIMPKHDDGTILSKDELENHEIFTKHVGVLWNKDDDGQTISFHGTVDLGSQNEKEKYDLNVFKSWIEREEPTVNKDFEDLTRFFVPNQPFSYEDIQIEILKLPEGLEQYFGEIAPSSEQDLPELSKPMTNDDLFPYQKKAVSEWQKNDNRGIFEMATGTGKTFTGIGCLKTIHEKQKQLFAVIAVPYDNLLDQWQDELAVWKINSKILKSGWTKILRDEVDTFNDSKENRFTVFLTSHDKFADGKFAKEIERMTKPVMLIADEAHHLGTTSAQKGLTENYTYRLALSATIERYYDADGTDALKKYFHGTVYEYTLEKAIKEKKLCEYNYYPFFVELTPDEEEKWKKHTNRIIYLMHSKNPAERAKVKEAFINRSRIIKNAAGKIPAFHEILEVIGEPIKHTLIFDTEKQNPRVNWICKSAPDHLSTFKKAILAREIVHDNPPDPRGRMKILNEFADEKWDAIFSNKVLDEGVDVPQAKIGIVLSSSGNPTQFIQRRGRVLRLYSGVYGDGTKKTHADIYDVLVKPQFDPNADPDILKTEIQIIKNQYSRIKYMSELALNKTHCIAKIKEFLSGLPEEYFSNP